MTAHYAATASTTMTSEPLRAATAGAGGWPALVSPRPSLGVVGRGRASRRRACARRCAPRTEGDRVTG
jgi:hypothetical protein